MGSSDSGRMMEGRVMMDSRSSKKRLSSREEFRSWFPIMVRIAS